MDAPSVSFRALAPSPAVALALSCALLTGCATAAERAASAPAAASSPVTTASGLIYESVKDGTGPNPRATDVVTVHYRGTLRRRHRVRQLLQAQRARRVPADARDPVLDRGPAAHEGRRQGPAHLPAGDRLRRARRRRRDPAERHAALRGRAAEGRRAMTDRPRAEDVADARRALAETRAWVERAVIGLNLCPFARAVEARGHPLRALRERRSRGAARTPARGDAAAGRGRSGVARDDADRAPARAAGLPRLQRLPRPRRGDWTRSATPARCRSRASIRTTSSPTPRPTTPATPPTARPIPRCTCCARTAWSARSRPFPRPRRSTSATSRRWNGSATPAGPRCGRPAARTHGARSRAEGTERPAPRRPFVSPDGRRRPPEQALRQAHPRQHQRRRRRCRPPRRRAAARARPPRRRRRAAPARIDQALDRVVQRAACRASRMPPPTRNIAAVPATDSAFISHGAARRMPRPRRAARRALRAAAQVQPGVVELHDAGDEAVDADRHDRARCRPAPPRCVREGLPRHRAERDRDDLGREDEVGAHRALDLVLLERDQVDRRVGHRLRAARAWCAVVLGRLCRNLCASFSKPSKHRKAPPIISSGVTAQGAKALMRQRRRHQDRLVDAASPWPPPTPPAARGRR